MDGSEIEANAGRASRVTRAYLPEIEAQNPIHDDEDPGGGGKAGKTVSTSDPDARWSAKSGAAKFAYFTNYMIDKFKNQSFI